MSSFIALLRGINVSGQKKVKMEDLRNLLLKAGLKNVSTYIQSGNILFQHEKTEPEELAETIHRAIKEQYGFEVPVIVRTPKELITIKENSPYAAPGHDMSKVYIVFLKAPPSEEGKIRLSGVPVNNEEYVIHGREVYLYCPDGFGRARLNNNIVENKLRTVASTRNWKTLNKLIELINNSEQSSVD